MLFIWRGFGWAVPVIVVVSFVLIQLLLNAFLGKGAYEGSDWTKMIAVGVSAVCIGFLGYTFNHKKRVISVDDQTGVKTKSRSHTFFFIPVEYWALIIPILFILMQNYSAEKDSEYMAYITAPMVDDQYLVDYTKLYQETDKKFKYGVLNVISVDADSVIVLVSKVAYNKKSGATKDVRKGKANQESYYSDNVLAFTKEELVSLKEKDAIYSVVRP